MSGSERFVPDVLALEENEAVRRLRAAGFAEVRVGVTRPPWPGEGKGQRRVLRQREMQDGSVALIVASTGHEGKPRRAR
jgi:hypothetical protein